MSGYLCARISKETFLLQIVVGSTIQLPLIPSSLTLLLTIMVLAFARVHLATAGYKMNKDDEMASTFESFIRDHSAPNALFIDHSNAQIGCVVYKSLCMYPFKYIQSKPHYQLQNMDEQRIQEVVKMFNRLMDCTKTNPASGCYVSTISITF
jgi:hypothetical protein